ncbi:MAG: hypothetical protein ACQESP_08030, partial [Candidatus Muiribacteriota bacterium]
HVNCLLPALQELEFRISESIHSRLDEEKTVEITLNKNVYDGRYLVLPKGLKGELEITETARAKPLLKPGRIRAKIKFIDTWYGDRIYFNQEDFELASKPVLNPFFGGIGYIARGIKGGLLLFAGTSTENVLVKKNSTFKIRTQKNLRIWGISD